MGVVSDDPDDVGGGADVGTDHLLGRVELEALSGLPGGGAVAERSAGGGLGRAGAFGGGGATERALVMTHLEQETSRQDLVPLSLSLFVYLSYDGLALVFFSLSMLVSDLFVPDVHGQLRKVQAGALLGLVLPRHPKGRGCGGLPA